MRKIKEIIIHCSATKEGRNFTVADIDRWHRERGMRCIGYHFVIYRDGSIHVGRAIEEVGAHCKGHNSISIGICYIGGLSKKGKPKDTRTRDQKAARAVHRGISNENAFQAAILVTGSERSVTVRRALAFSAGVGSRIHLERVHGITGQAGVGRRAVRNRVIGAGPHRSGRSAGTKSRGVVSEERINSAEEAIGTEHAAKDRQAAKRQSTEAAGNADGSFTAEEAAILLGIRETRVRFKTRLENEAHLVAVAEVLSTPQAPAGTEFLTVIHGKRVGVRNTSHVRVRVDIAETRIDQAIELNIGSRGSSDHTGGNA